LRAKVCSQCGQAFPVEKLARRDLDDARIDMLASDLARRIESEMDYPGKIKVTVIREIRAQEVAR
jgi:ribonuclease Y